MTKKKKKSILEEATARRWMSLSGTGKLEDGFATRYIFENDEADAEELEEEAADEGDDFEESENLGKGEKGEASKGGNSNIGHSKEDGVSNHGAGKDDKTTEKKLKAPDGGGKPLMEFDGGFEDEEEEELGGEELPPAPEAGLEPEMGDEMGPDIDAELEPEIGMEGGDDKESKFKELVNMLADLLDVEVSVDGGHGEPDGDEALPPPAPEDDLGPEMEPEFDDEPEEELAETGSRQDQRPAADHAPGQNRRHDKLSEAAMIEKITRRVAERLTKKVQHKKK